LAENTLAVLAKPFEVDHMLAALGPFLVVTLGSLAVVVGILAAVVGSLSIVEGSLVAVGSSLVVVVDDHMGYLVVARHHGV